MNRGGGGGEGGVMKNRYTGMIGLKKRFRQFAGLRGTWQERVRRCFSGKGDIPMHTMNKL